MSEVEFVLGWAFTLFSASLQTPEQAITYILRQQAATTKRQEC